MYFQDVEGSEVDVLRGTDFSRFTVNVIFYETTRTGTEPVDLVVTKILNEAGYTVCEKIEGNKACHKEGWIPSRKPS